MKSNVFRLLLANIITISGTALVRVPLSQYFSQFWGVSFSYSLMLIFQLLPVVMLSPVYGRLAKALGAYKTIKYSQLAGAVATVAIFICIRFENPYLTLGLIAVYHVVSSPLKLLFSSVLNLVSKNEDEAVSNFSNWSIAFSLIMILATTTGSFLAENLNLSVIYLIDLLSYFVAFYLWSSPNISKHLNHLEVQKELVLKRFLHLAFSGLMLSHLLRSFAWGFVNIMFAVFVIDKFSMNTNNLGVLYFFVGVSSVVGGFIAKSVRVRWQLICGFVAIEGVILCFSMVANQFWGYIALVCISSMIAPVVAIGFQTLFISRHDKSESDQRSIVMESLSHLGLLLGFLCASLVKLDSLGSYPYIWILIASLLALLALVFPVMSRKIVSVEKVLE